MRWMLFVLMVGLTLVPAAADKPAQFGEESDGKSVTLKVGDLFEITLPENPTTGYSWQVVEGLGGVVVRLGKPEFHPNRRGSHLVGVGGTITWRFTAAGKGTTTLRLIYHRRWEKDKLPAKTFHLTVTVS